MNNKKYPPLQVTIRWTSEPFDFNQEDKINVAYRFEKTLKVTKYDPNTDYNKALKEALDILMDKTKQYTKGSEPKVFVTIKMELDTEDNFICNPGYIMMIDEALVSLNKYVEDYFIGPELFEIE